MQNNKKDGGKVFFKNLGNVLADNSEKIRGLVHNTIVVPPPNSKRRNRPIPKHARAETKPSTRSSEGAKASAEERNRTNSHCSEDDVDPEQYFESDVEPEQYFDDGIDPEWSAATAHIDDYDIPPAFSATLPNEDATAPFDKEFCGGFDDVDHEWLAATSSIPDVDVPPECAKEEVAIDTPDDVPVLVDHVAVENVEPLVDHPLVFAPPIVLTDAEREELFHHGMATHEVVGHHQNEDVEDGNAMFDDEVSEMGNTTIVSAGGETHYTILEELERLRALVIANDLHIPTTLPIDEASVRTTPIL